MFACRLLTALLVLGSGTRMVSAQDAPPPLLVPGLPPTYEVSMTYYQTSVQQRIELLAERERELLRAGRPENYRLKRGISIAAISVGGALFAFGAYAGAFMSANGNAMPYLVTMGAGGAMCLGGVAGLVVNRRRMPYREEIEALRAERVYWKEELQRLRAQGTGELSRVGRPELLLGPGGVVLRTRF